MPSSVVGDGAVAGGAAAVKGVSAGTEHAASIPSATSPMIDRSIVFIGTSLSSVIFADQDKLLVKAL